MTVTIVLAYALIISYFLIERSLRKGAAALKLQPGEFDQSSSKLTIISGFLCLMIALFAPLLNVHQIGFWEIGVISWLGIAVMVAGLALRYWAASTLGEFYTRTLKIVDGQTIIQQAPYNVIRHPGYAGLFLIEIGAGLAVSNWVVLMAVLILGVPSRWYRIQVEEQMLETVLTEQYRAYQKQTWKLIPLVY